MLLVALARRGGTALHVVGSASRARGSRYLLQDSVSHLVPLLSPRGDVYLEVQAVVYEKIGNAVEEVHHGMVDGALIDRVFERHLLPGLNALLVNGSEPLDKGDSDFVEILNRFQELRQSCGKSIKERCSRSHRVSPKRVVAEEGRREPCVILESFIPDVVRHTGVCFDEF